MPERKVTSQTVEQIKDYLKANGGQWLMDTDTKGKVSGNGIWKFRDEPLVIHANVEDLPNRFVILSDRQWQEFNTAGINLTEDSRLLESERAVYERDRALLKRRR